MEKEIKKRLLQALEGYICGNSEILEDLGVEDLTDFCAEEGYEIVRDKADFCAEMEEEFNLDKEIKLAVSLLIQRYELIRE